MWHYFCRPSPYRGLDTLAIRGLDGTPFTKIALKSPPVNTLRFHGLRGGCGPPQERFGWYRLSDRPYLKEVRKVSSFPRSRVT
jgi:hypothetical protein